MAGTFEACASSIKIRAINLLQAAWELFKMFSLSPSIEIINCNKLTQ